VKFLKNQFLMFNFINVYDLTLDEYGKHENVKIIKGIQGIILHFEKDYIEIFFNDDKKLQVFNFIIKLITQ
jgi:hypothetical protein